MNDAVLFYVDLHAKDILRHMTQARKVEDDQEGSKMEEGEAGNDEDDEQEGEEGQQSY